MVDGVFQHDPLYPTESDKNGNINNVIEIGQTLTKFEDSLTKSSSWVINKKESTDALHDDSFKEPKSAESANSIDVAVSKDISDNITENAHTDEGSQPNEKAEIILDPQTSNSLAVNNIGQGDNTSLVIHVIFKKNMFFRWE